MENFAKTPNTVPLPCSIRAEWTAYAVFSILFVPLSLLFLNSYLQNPSANSGQPVFFSVGILAFFLIWISAFKINLTQQGITYKTLFSKGFQIDFSSIKKIDVAIGINAGRKGGFYRLNLTTTDSAEPFTINMKPFSKRELATLIGAIVAATPAVELDGFSKQLYEGNFNPIVSQGIRKLWQVTLSMFFFFPSLMLLKHFVVHQP
jgi:hypothetical protein